MTIKFIPHYSHVHSEKCSTDPSSCEIYCGICHEIGKEPLAHKVGEVFHVFCRDCITKWHAGRSVLREVAECPYCKKIAESLVPVNLAEILREEEALPEDPMAAELAEIAAGGGDHRIQEFEEIVQRFAIGIAPAIERLQEIATARNLGILAVSAVAFSVLIKFRFAEDE